MNSSLRFKLPAVFALLLTLVSAGPALAGGDLVNNGGGMSEKTILFAMEKLETYLQSCLNSPSCRLDSPQRSALTRIYEGLPQDRLNPNLIQFMSESKNPGFFILEGEAKVAKTGSTPGSPIYINIDMIYSRDAWGNPVPTGLPESIAILVHELGHHHLSESHEFLDLLGVRVGMFHSLQSYNTPALPWLENFGVTAINIPEKTGFPELLLQLNDISVDLSDDVRAASFCLWKQFPTSDPVAYKPFGTLVYNLHWSSAKERGDSSELVMSATLRHNCQPPHPRSAEPQQQEHELIITFKVKQFSSPSGPHYQLKRIRTEQLASRQWL